MAYFNKKKLAPFFLLILLVSQLSIEVPFDDSILDFNKTFLNPLKIITTEIAIKPVVSYQDSLTRDQYQIGFTNIIPSSLYKTTAIEIKQHRFITLYADYSDSFLINRMLRI